MSSGATWHHSKCKCSVPASSKIINFKWREVPLSTGTNLAFTGLKVVSWTIGIIPTAIFHATGNGYKSNTHDCIEFYFLCDKCLLKAYRLIGMDSRGKRFTQTYYAGNGAKRSCNVGDGALTYGDVRAVFEASKGYPSWSSGYNCGHCARDVYLDLYNH